METLHQCKICEKVQGCNLTGNSAIRKCFHCWEPDCIFNHAKPDRIVETICLKCYNPSIEFGLKLKEARNG